MDRSILCNRKKKGLLLLLLLISALLLIGCTMGGGSKTLPDSELTNASWRTTLTIASGSENKELEPLLSRFAKENKINLDMRYKGSIDIARELGLDTVPFDAVWPASSMWISIGDTRHRVKYAESVSTTPVVFGIKESLAKKLGFVGRQVSVRDILDKIQTGELTFCMTSATQSNSGCSAYIGFLYALLDNPDMITADMLAQDTLRTDIMALLSGVDRSSGSSEWLKTLFLEGEYDAMVNYESLILSANRELVQQGREPLYIIYPYDGLSLSDAPLGYVDQGNKQKEEAFQKLKSFLMSEEVQKEIQAYGRRTGYAGIAAEHQAVWKKEWGADLDIILSPIRMPEAEVLGTALNLYQTQFRKPSLTAYVLDFSGSMSGDPSKQLKKAMERVLIQQYAAENLLQASQGEENIVVLFSSRVEKVVSATGSVDIENLYTHIAQESPSGGTAMYEALHETLALMGGYDVSDYTPAVILMTDGEANGKLDFEDFQQFYEDAGNNIPVFCISFGNADVKALERIAEMTKARVFDGGKDLIEAFRKAKGYN